MQTERSDAQLKDLKVVVTSGRNNLGSVAKDIGADGFLKKPFELDDLYKIVNETLTPAR